MRTIRHERRRKQPPEAVGSRVSSDIESEPHGGDGFTGVGSKRTEDDIPDGKHRRKIAVRLGLVGRMVHLVQIRCDNQIVEIAVNHSRDAKIGV